jgi:hypothetical protein
VNYSKHHHVDHVTASFYAHASFFSQGADVSLDMHTDDSDVTFNVNVCDGFRGAGLSFCGQYGNVDRRLLNHVSSFSFSFSLSLFLDVIDLIVKHPPYLPLIDCSGMKIFLLISLPLCSALSASQVYEHKLGRAVIHSGLHTHGADDLTAGERYACGEIVRFITV